MNKEEIKTKMQEIYDKCYKVYGTCTDGSFNAALYAYGYFELKKQLEKDNNDE